MLSVPVPAVSEEGVERRRTQRTPRLRRLIDNSSIGDAEFDLTALSIRPKVHFAFFLLEIVTWTSSENFPTCQGVVHGTADSASCAHCNVTLDDLHPRTNKRRRTL